MNRCLRFAVLAVIMGLALSACGSSDQQKVSIDTTAAAANRKAAGRAQLDAEATQARSKYGVSDPAMARSSANSMSASALSSVGTYDSPQKSFSMMQALTTAAVAAAPALLLSGKLDLQNLLPTPNKAIAEKPSSGGQSAGAGTAPATALSMAQPQQGSRSGARRGDDVVIVTNEGIKAPDQSKPTTDSVAAPNASAALSLETGRSSGVSKANEGTAICKSEGPGAQDVRDAYAIIQSVEQETKGVKI